MFIIKDLKNYYHYVCHHSRCCSIFCYCRSSIFDHSPNFRYWNFSLCESQISNWYRVYNRQWMIFLECPGNNHHFCRFLFVNEQNSCSDNWNRYRNNSLTCQLVLTRMRDVLILKRKGDCRKIKSHSNSKISSIISSSRRSINNSNRESNSNSNDNINSISNRNSNSNINSNSNSNRNFYRNSISNSNSNSNSNRNNSFDIAILQKTSRKSAALNTTRGISKKYLKLR